MTDQQDTVTTALPTPGAGPQMRMVEVNLIEESLTNPRKHFDAARLQELADSIKASGVHQPVLLRPLPGHRVPDTWSFRRKGSALPAYELVAGARRLRACRLAGVAEIPAMIRELTDDQAMEAAIIENLQREDVSVMEEAEGFRVLMERSAMTAKDVAGKIGKSVRHVYQRLQLLELTHEAAEALRTGTIDPSKAREISYIPDPKLQAKALTYASEKDHKGDPSHSTRDVAQWVRMNIMLRMDRARFDTGSATLCPAAGACSTCPKRTGSNPDLFANADGPDLCTDPACYHAKEDAHDETTVEKAKKLGGKVITAAEARELISSPNLVNTGFKGYVLLDESAYEIGVIGITVRKALGKDCPEVTTIIHPRTGEPVAAVKASTAKRIIAERRAATREKEKENAKAEEAALPIEKRTDYIDKWTQQAPDLVASKINGALAIPPELLRAIMLDYFDDYGDVEAFGPALGLAPEFSDAEAEQRLETLTDEETPAVFMRWKLFQAMEATHNQSNLLTMTRPRHTLCILADAVGVSIQEVQASVKRAIESEERAKALEAEKPSTPTAPAAQAVTSRAKGKAPKRPAAQATDTAPKTSKEHATAQIAAAMTALEDKDVAPAAQGNEAPAVADAQPVATPAWHLHPQAAWPLPTAPVKGKAPAAQTKKKASPVADAQASHAPSGQDSADVDTGAAMVPGVLAVGVSVKVNATASGQKQKAMVGKVGVIQRQIGPNAWDVRFPSPRAPTVGKFVCFDASELEVVHV